MSIRDRIRDIGQQSVWKHNDDGNDNDDVDNDDDDDDDGDDDDDDDDDDDEHDDDDDNESVDCMLNVTSVSVEHNAFY